MPSTPSQRTDQFWFLNLLVTIRISYQDGSNGISVMEHWAPRGDSAPLHVHRDEDEIFQILHGEVTFKFGDVLRQCKAGETVLAPSGVAHTYRVDSADAKFLTITAKTEFERFVRLLGRKPERLELPPPTVPTPAMIEALAAAAREHGIEIVGPPLS